MIVKLISSIIPSIIGIILNNLIISRFGSDTNGLLATFGQIVNFLTIFEGGLTLATNVALYKPYLEKNYSLINNILTATKKIYFRIGIIITVISVIVAVILPKILKSNLDSQLITILFLIIASNLIIQFLFSMKYNIMFSVSQKEHLIGFYFMIFNVLSQCASIAVILIGGNIVTVKLTALAVTIIRIPIIILLFKSHFSNINFKSRTPDFSVLKSTKDVLTQKLASLVFDATDMVIISIAINTMQSSIYSVYNMIFTFIKMIVFSVVLAPFNAFGQLYAEGLKGKFSEYNTKFQYLSICIANVFISTTSILIIPFIQLYTRNVTDINYIDNRFAILFSLFCILQVLSNIFGVVANSSGQFKEMKFISLIGTIVNITLSILLVGKLGIHGVIIGSIVAYIIMLVAQVYLVHIKMLNDGLARFIIILMENVGLHIVVILLSKIFTIHFVNYFQFIIAGCIVFSAASIIIVLFNYLFNNKLTRDIIIQINNK